MAVRLHKRHDEAARRMIQTDHLLQRLMDHALGEVEMTANQIQAARILLKKTLPDLKVVELGNADDGPLEIKIVRHADS